MRRRILLLVVGMTTLVVLAFAIPLAVLVRNNEYDDALAKLRTDTNGIGFQLSYYRTTRTEAQINAILAKFNDRKASVQLPSGRVLGAAPPGGVDAVPGVPSNSDRNPAGPSTAAASAAPGSGAGNPFGDRGGRGGPAETMPVHFRGGELSQLRVPAFQQTGGEYTVRVWASDSSLRSGENGPWLLLAGASVGLLLLGVLLGELLTRRIVRPLENTSETAQRLAAGDVTARATTSGPVEVADVGRALNRLADRIDQLIAEERETVADLSHRLRTPLTALRLDAEALHDPADAELIGGHVNALERMLTAVIHAARRGQREGRMPSCDATAVVGERVAFWSALTDDQQRASTVSLPDGPVAVRAGAEDLAAAVDALLENVVAHTPEGTAFTVTLVARAGGAGADAGSARAAAQAGGARLTIGDDGPGLPFETPVRGRSDRGSTGLGLDIARRCAESSGGSMTLGATASGGALITLELNGP